MGRIRLRMWLTIILFTLFLLVTLDKLGGMREIGGHGMDQVAMREMLGTFNDPKGKEGNYINFELVPSPIKTGSALGTVQARSGAGHLHEMLGFEDMEFVWGYNEWDPRLKISIVPKKSDLGIESPAPMGSLEITALGHQFVQIRPLPVRVQNGRVKDIFPGKQQVLSLSRTREPQYPPPKF